MLTQGVVTADDIRRWNDAFEVMDGVSERPTLFNPTFIAVGRRPE